MFRKFKGAAALFLCAVVMLSLAACGGAGGGGDGGGPALSVSTTSLTFTAIQNGATPSSQNVGVSVSGGTVYVGIFPNGSAFSATLNTTGATTGNVTVSPVAPNMSPGTYSGTITVRGCRAIDCSTGDVGGSPKTINVTYAIQPPTGLAATPQSLSFDQIRNGSTPAPQTLGISDLGGANYAWNASITYQSGNGWLNVNNASQVSGSSLPTSLSLSINPSITTGSLAAVVHVTGNNNAIDVPVSYTVREPQVAASPAQLTFNAANQGALPVTQDLTLTTEGGLPVSYAAAVNYGAGATGWLNVPTTGSAPGTLTVGVNTTGLAAGTYTATVNLTTASQTVSIGVTYTLAVSSLTMDPSSATFNIDPASVAADLNRTINVGTTGVPLNWTASSSEPWLTVAPASGTSGQTVTLSLVPAQLDALDAGLRSASVTFTFSPTGGSSSSTQLAVTLNLQLPKVNYVSPYVTQPNTTQEVILRGSGFSNATGLNVMFDASPVPTYTVVSDTEIRVSHPPLAAGSYPVKIPNQLGLTRSRANLVVVAPPSFAYAALPTSLVRDRIIYDAERAAVYTNNFSAMYGGPAGVPRIERHRWNGAAWTTDSILLTGAPYDIALTPDGAELIALDSATLYHIDLNSWSIAHQIDISSLPYPVNVSSFSRLAMGNDGNALVYLGSSWITPYQYNVLARTFVAVPGFSNGLYGSIPPVRSLDGSRILVAQNGISGPLKLYYFDTSVAQLVQALPDHPGSRMSYDRTGSNSIIDGTVFNRQFQAQGSMLGVQSVISPDGTRAYGVVPGATPLVLSTYDLTSPDGVGGFNTIGSGITIPDAPGDFLAFGITPDGRTVFISGFSKFIVQPLP